MKEDAPKQNNELKSIVTTLLVAIIIAAINYLITKKFSSSLIILISIFILFQAYFIIKTILTKTARIRKMEEVFPDFIELMASNLRAGMTIDKALLLSSRKEFAPLDIEILNLGKDILTGREINNALNDMAKRINSEKILKTITVINSGIKSGGNLAILLEKTAINMRERSFVEKRAASNVLMYLIFISFAVTVGAPILFSLSTVLVKILSSILLNIPSIETSTINIPFKFTTLNISLDFITYFSVIFLITIDILASFLLGLVSKGEEKAGLKYLIPLIAVSITIFIIIKEVMFKQLSGLVS